MRDSKEGYTHWDESAEGRNKAIAHHFCVKQSCGQPFPCSVWGVRRRADRCGLAFMIIGGVLLILASTASVFVKYVIKRGIDQQTIVAQPRGEAWKTFVTSGENQGVKIYFAVSWLNVTNPSEAVAGARPILEEAGPYVYREYRRKLNISFESDGDVASFVLRKWFVWDDEANKGSGLDDRQDEITTVSPVSRVLQQQLQAALVTLLSAGSLGEEFGGPFDEAWKVMYKLVLCQGNVQGVSPFTTRSARDLFWGYHGDAVLQTMQHVVDRAQQVASAVGRSVSLPIVPEAFPGLYTNLTSDADAARRVGPNAVHTGKHDKGRIQEYVRFQNMSQVYACPDPTSGPEPEDGEMPSCYVYQAAWDAETAAEHGYIPQWASPITNEVRGTDGSMFKHPMHEDSIFTFQEDYRRYIELVYENETDYHGLKLRRYIFQDGDWRNDSRLSAAWFQDNLPTGLGNLTHIGGFPLYLSKPHFLESDPFVSNMVSGLRPDRRLHLTHIDVEPSSGVTFHTHKRVQINAGLSDLNFPKMSRLRVWALARALDMQLSEETNLCMQQPVEWKFGEMLYLPMAWYDESFAMTEKFTADFKRQVYGSQKAARLFQIIGCTIAVCMILGSVGVMMRVRSRERAAAESRTGTYTALAGEEEEDI